MNAAPSDKGPVPAAPPDRIMLTGATGALGRHVLDVVAGRPGSRVAALLRPGVPRTLPRQEVETEQVSLHDKERVAAIVRAYQPSCFVHCAATGMDFPRATWFDLVRFNVNVTVDLCEAVASVPGCRFVFVSTGLAYRSLGRRLVEDDVLDTQHPYGASKAAADLLVRSAAAEFEVPLTVLRPFSFTGPGDDRTRLFGSLLRAAAEGRPMKLSPCTQARDHCSVRDVADGVVRSIDARPGDARAARIYNLGSGDDTPLRALVERVRSELELDVELEFGALEMRRFEPAYLVADVTRAARELGWRPRHNLAHAVWQLARSSFPTVPVREPEESA